MYPEPTPFGDPVAWLHSLNGPQVFIPIAVMLLLIVLFWGGYIVFINDYNSPESKLKREQEEIDLKTKIVNAQIQYVRQQQQLLEAEQRLKAPQPCTKCGVQHAYGCR